MSSSRALFAIVAIVSMAIGGQANAGPNANAVLSVDLITDGGAGKSIWSHLPRAPRPAMYSRRTG